jgi:flagellar export protein FliJ
VKDLRTLIRLYKWELDEKRRALSQLEAIVAGLEREREKLQAEMVAEAAAAGQSFEASLTYPAYLKHAKARGAHLERAIAMAQRDVEQAGEAVQAAFEELKRMELAQEQREQQRQLEIKRREGQELDEIGAIGFERRQRDSS